MYLSICKIKSFSRFCIFCKCINVKICEAIIDITAYITLLIVDITVLPQLIANICNLLLVIVKIGN